MSRRVTLALLSVQLGAATPAHADPGLSSLEGLAPLYITALVVFFLLFFALPAWLTFRARSIHEDRGISKTKLRFLLAPAGLVGSFGVIDYLAPISLASSISYDLTGGFAPYLAYVGLSALLLYLAVSTYRRCIRPLAPAPPKV